MKFLLLIQFIIQHDLLTEDFLKSFNIKTIFYDPHDLNSLKNKISKKTKLIYVESPGSNSFEFQDLI